MTEVSYYCFYRSFPGTYNLATVERTYVVVFTQDYIRLTVANIIDYIRCVENPLYF